MNKEELKQVVTGVQKINGILQLNYTPSSVLSSTNELYGLYYGGDCNIKISKTHFINNRTLDSIKITDENLDEIIDSVIAILEDNISNQIHAAIKNLEMSYEDLKYFDRDLSKYEKFRDEVLRLKNN